MTSDRALPTTFGGGRVRLGAKPEAADLKQSFRSAPISGHCRIDPKGRDAGTLVQPVAMSGLPPSV